MTLLLVYLAAAVYVAVILYFDLRGAKGYDHAIISAIWLGLIWPLLLADILYSIWQEHK